MADAADLEKPLYTSLPDVKPIVPFRVWRIIEAISALSYFGMIFLLFKYPAVGLFLLWVVIIPSAPMIFLLFLGLWRNICPIAAVNQTPRIFKFSKAKETPQFLKNYGYVISLILIAAIIPMRKVALNMNGAAIAWVMLGIIISSFTMGFFFKGKSGWCTSMCPILPFERLYGQMPFYWVRNSYCEPCIGCTQNCYDFNPYISNLNVLTGKDKRAAGFRKFFGAALPGFIVAFYVVPSPPTISIGYMYFQFAGLMSASIALHYTWLTFSGLRETVLNFIFGITALNLFYWYTFKMIQQQFAKVLGWYAPLHLTDFASLMLLVVSMVWLVRALRNEEKYLRSEYYEGPQVILKQKIPVVKAKGPIALTPKTAGPSGTAMVKVLPQNIELRVEINKLLLGILEENKITIEAGCHMGMCGSDPVTIVEGMENLSPPTQHEKDTLKRLGNSERARLSCSARVRGDVVISLEKEFKSDVKITVKIAEGVNSEVKKVVVVGNGIAGMTAAEHVRHLNPECEVIIVAKEGYQLYNRMAIASLIYGRNSMDSLFLLPQGKEKDAHEQIWYNTLVTEIRREAKELILGTGEKLSYDKLILATGSSGFIPPIDNFGVQGTFVLREAEDAMKIRSYIQENGACEAIVAGGGLLGLEAAYALKNFKQKVTIIEFAERLLPRQLDIIGSSFLLQYLFSLGIEVRTRAVCDSLKVTDHVIGLYLKDQTYLNCDVFLACAGIKPNIELAKKAGLKVNRGVVVDDKMTTSDPNIYAIGDLAESLGRVEGLWLSAINQAKVAADSALGLSNSYQGTVAHTLLKVAGIHLASIGEFEPSNDSDVVISLMDVHAYHYRKLVLSGGKIKGAILIGFPEEATLIASAITQKVNMEPYLSELIKGDWKVLRSL